MGKILIVENTTSLLDRIDTRNINHRITSNGPLHSSHRSYSHSHPRGTSSGRRPPRERKVGGKTRAAKKTAEDLDKELENYNPELLKKPQVIAANKIDAIYGDENDIIDQLKAEFEPKGIQVYAISAVSGQGVRELLFHVKELLDSCPQEPVVFEQEFFPEDMLIGENLPYTVEQSPEDPTIFVVEGPKIEKMLGYTNLDSEKGFAFFQKFLKEGGILEELEKAGIQEGDTVRMYGFDFDYYK